MHAFKTLFKRLILNSWSFFSSNFNFAINLSYVYFFTNSKFLTKPVGILTNSGFLDHERGFYPFFKIKWIISNPSFKVLFETLNWILSVSWEVTQDCSNHPWCVFRFIFPLWNHRYVLFGEPDAHNFGLLKEGFPSW